ncbi:Myc-type, basic helix-loop-helix (bHLH) domain [Dillenia turbinata]|uniref:Myc-type, basic helix-loop-helix (BHLH) domain n=1 Tax=Dillenia turbinata TaxID=194707 RepID=A0AAN8UF41_9MAGN
MEKEENFSAALSANFTSLDYSLEDHHNSHPSMKSRIGEDSDDHNNGMVDYMLNATQQHQMPSGFCTSTSLEHRLSFADVMQFADFGPKLALNQAKINEEETGIDPVYFLKFPVLNEKLQDESSLMVPQHVGDSNEERFKGMSLEERTIMIDEEKGENEEELRASENTSVQIRFLGENIPTGAPMVELAKSKRKRPRTIKSSEEVESQRMTHIAVERNRRKQMNEHLRVLRSLMPGSYVQRGDQASIIGGAIEFVRELEQLLQCLESQKRRRLYGEGPRQVGDPSLALQQPPPPPFFPPLPLPSEQINYETPEGLREEIAENKSCLADVEVKRLGFDAMIKILSRKRPGQLVKTIAALEDLQLSILHTNITTIEQTVLYSFNVKVGSESSFTAEDIASSVQQIFSFIHANSNM